jgi:SAM-dependent methyltransferase
MEESILEIRPPQETDEEFAIKAVKEDTALIHREHGVQRHRYINGNAISFAQREKLFITYVHLARYLFKSKILALIVGGPKFEFPADECKVLNVIGPNDYPNYIGTGINEKDETFHVVSSCHSFEHLKDPRGSIHEFTRVLKVGGFLTMVVPNRLLHRHDMSNHKLGDRCYNEWTPEECLALFKEYIDNKVLSLIQFNTNDNKLDFEMIFRKEKNKED